MKKNISKVMIIALLAQSFATSVFAGPLSDIRNSIPENYEEVEGQCGPFKDVSSDHPNCDAIVYAYDNGIVGGYPDGTFRPENIVVRAELTKIMMESTLTDSDIEDCELTPFPDSPRGEWFTKYICAAYSKGIIGGYPDGSFGPGKAVNFAEASKIIVNAFEYEVCESTEWYEPFVKKLISMNAVPETVEDVESYMTRGEVVEVIYRLLENITNKDSRTYEELNGVEGTGTCSEENQDGGEEEDTTPTFDGPDLSVTDIFIDEKGYFSFEVSNVGDVDIDEVNGDGAVTFYVNNIAVDALMLIVESYDYGDDFLMAGESTVFKNSDVKPDGGDEVKVCIDTAAIISNDGNTNNDCMEVSMEVSLPDLSITEVSTDANGHLTYEVSNIGNADITEELNGDMAEGDLQVYINGVLTSVSVLGMEVIDYDDEFKKSGGSTVFTDYDVDPVGGNEIKVCVESGDIITNDADTGNDCMTKKFTTDLSITNISVDAKGNLTYEVSNIGNADITEELNGDMAEGDLQVYLNGVLTSVSVLGMEVIDYDDEFKKSGGSTVFTDYDVDPVGGNEIKVCVESGDIITNDADTGNDCMTKKF